MYSTRFSSFTKLTLVLGLLLVAASGSAQTADQTLPPGITDVMNSPRYADATWSLFVVDVETGETVYELAPDTLLLTGSVRKTFSAPRRN